MPTRKVMTASALLGWSIATSVAQSQTARGWRHPAAGALCDALDQQALVRGTGDHGGAAVAELQGAVMVVQAQVGHACGLVGTVALRAVLGDEGAYVAAELDLLGRRADGRHCDDRCDFDQDSGPHRSGTQE